jgi:hypothetical protein
VATTGNGTYGQFYQRDASGGFTAGGGDLRLGSSGVPGRRVPLASSQACLGAQSEHAAFRRHQQQGRPANR